MEIVDKYDPYNIPESRALLKGTVSEFLCYAKSQGVAIDLCDCRSACGVCYKIMAALEHKTKKA